MTHRRQAKETMRAEREAQRRAMNAEQRNRILLGLSAVAVAFALVAVLVSLPGGPQIAQGAPAVGEPAPDFTIVDIDGSAFRLSAQAGHPVLLDFMGANCPTCVAEMPELRSIYSTYASRGLVMISIDVGGYLGTEDPNVAREFITKNGGSWPIALDAAGVGLRYGVVLPPTVYIIDPWGVVAYRNAGTTSSSTLLDVIARYV